MSQSADQWRLVTKRRHVQFDLVDAGEPPPRLLATPAKWRALMQVMEVAVPLASWCVSLTVQVPLQARH